MIIALSCAADLPASRETLTSFSNSSFARVRKFHVNNWLRPRKFLLFYFSAKNERVSIARLVVFTYRSMACMH